ncbi:unnamed protein product [Brassica rapa]|uniref:Uncharacterized protein n=1 Tax=Brassica campestris TaxID=3711 RepID=A0A3P6D7U0_BRACM|nr:unnamed protein product [Brassica rapa]VDD23170.1 unnamed protein product [Brassica rapa]
MPPEEAMEKFIEVCHSAIPNLVRRWRGTNLVISALLSSKSRICLKELKAAFLYMQRDNKGQTALHYAVVCDREAIAEFLVKQKANTASKDDNGKLSTGFLQSHGGSL